MEHHFAKTKLLNLGNQPLTLIEAKNLLLNSTGKISSQPAVKPQGGFEYFFQGISDSSYSLTDACKYNSDTYYSLVDATKQDSDSYYSVADDFK